MPEFAAFAYIDSWYDSVNPGDNHGADTKINASVILADAKSRLSRVIGNFNVAALAGKTINSAKLVRYMAGGTLLAHQMKITRITRPADWVEGEVTWDDYKASTAWTTAGGDIDDVTPTRILFSEAGANGYHTVLGLGPFVQDALDNRSGIVSIQVRLSDENPAVTEWSRWRSHQFPMYNWRILVDYTPALGPGFGMEQRAGEPRE